METINIKAEIKRPLWKSILRWIAIIFAILLIVDGIGALYLYFTAGIEMTQMESYMWIIGLIILMKAGVVKYKPGRFIK